MARETFKEWLARRFGSTMKQHAGDLNAVLTDDSRLTDSRAPTGTAAGVLSGTYPNPGFAVNMATQDELDTALALKQNVITPAAHITDPSGGAIQDAEARTTIAAILDALEAKGILSA